MLEGGVLLSPPLFLILFYGRIAVAFRFLPDSFVADRFQMLDILKDVNFQQFWSPSPGTLVLFQVGCASGPV